MATTLLPRVVRNRDIMLRTLEGQTPETIADLYELELQTIKNILASPLVKDELVRLKGEMAKDIVEKVKERSHKALEVVSDTMDGELNSELRFKAAKDMLDRNPDLQPKKDSGLGELGQGIGEAIIRELARKRAEREPRDVGPQSGRQGTGETRALEQSESVGNP